MKTLKSILFALDVTPASWEALKTVIKLANITNSQVHVVHVIEPLRHFKNAALQHLHTRYERQRTQQLLQAVEKELVEQGVNFGGCSEVVGSVSDSVITTASQLAAELIVLGAGNLSANRAVGLTAQSIMEHAEQPVLVIHPEAKGMRRTLQLRLESDRRFSPVLS